MSRALTLATLLLILWPAAQAAAQSDTDCSQLCTPTTWCSEQCEDNGQWITCNEYGVCDVDIDDDGLPDNWDNCPGHYNPSQADCDGDGTGDVCDSENGTFYLTSTNGPCFIRSRLHFGWYEQNRYWEGLYRDGSACNSPDEWRYLGQETKNCAIWLGDYECCLNSWNSYTQCNQILDNNQCHY